MHTNKIIKAVTGASSRKQTHTESNRRMRGAWRVFCEYIPELRTKPRTGSRLRRFVHVKVQGIDRYLARQAM